MPTFEYVCEHCHLQWEQLLSIEERDDPTHQVCPRCSKPTVVRPTRCAGFILKGHCWSRDNYTTHVGDDPRYKAGKWNQNELE